MKVTKTVVGAIQVGHNPRHVCLTEGVCMVARVSSASAAQQQIRVGALSPIAIRLWASEDTPVGPVKDTHSTLGPE